MAQIARWEDQLSVLLQTSIGTRTPARAPSDTGAEEIRVGIPRQLCEKLEKPPVSYSEIIRRAKQIPRVVTNPASMDMPLVQYFYD